MTDRQMAFDGLLERVRSEGGWLVLRMGELRDALGYGKLGVHVRSTIAKELARRNLFHLPAELPRDQADEVRVFAMNSLQQRVVEAVLSPSAQGDRLLRKISTGNTGVESGMEKTERIIVAISEIIRRELG